jgi:hypothetical protein
MAERRPTYITLCGDEPVLVEAVFIEEVSLEEAARADEIWEADFFDLAAKYAHAGLSANDLPANWGWSWQQKMQDFAHEIKRKECVFCGIEYQGMMQGMLMMSIAPFPCVHSSRDENGLYVCYVGAAPWNLGLFLRRVGQQPKFDKIGSVLMDFAVDKSKERGYMGRLILHAVPGTEGFYRGYGMIEIGSDQEHPNRLIRFEMPSNESGINQE